jgi:ribonuclease HIII
LQTQELETDKEQTMKIVVHCKVPSTPQHKSQQQKKQIAVDDYRYKVYLSNFLEGLGLS